MGKIFFSKPIPDSLALLARRNQCFWRTAKAPKEQSDEIVLIEQQYHPLLVLVNGSFGATVALSLGLKPIFLTPSVDFPHHHLLASYNRADFCFTNDWGFFPSRIIASFRALFVFHQWQQPRDILSFAIDGIRLGDVVYDEIIRTGYATVDSVDYRAFQSLRDCFYFQAIALYLLKHYRIHSYVGHCVGVLNATVARLLLSHGVEILHRSGGHRFQLRRYVTLADLGQSPLRPEREYVDLLIDEKSNRIEKLAARHLERRFDQHANDLGGILAFAEGRRAYDTPFDFCVDAGLDPAKKLVFVMLHAFTDYPHTHLPRPMMFQDYYNWFRVTLDIAMEQTEVQWVFKEHPAAAYYPMRDADLADIFDTEVKHSPHIRFLSRHNDFDARSLRHIAHAIVTCQGTAGLEYSCLGIPCVLGSQSFYSDFGFTSEPQDLHQYAQCLKNIDSLPRLTQEQQRIAKIVVYLSRIVIPEPRDPFCPTYEETAIPSLTMQQVWNDAARLIDEDGHAVLHQHIDAILPFLQNSQQKQYLALQQMVPV